MDEFDKSTYLDLVTRCYSEWNASFVEQVRIPNPFPGQFGYIDDPDPLFTEFFLGDQWSRMGWMPEWKSRPVNNLVMPAVENYVTFVTDNQPSPSITPREEGDYWIAAPMRAAIDYWWDSEDMPSKVTQAVRASSIVGDAWLYAPYEDGKQKCYVLHRESVKVDSECTAENFDPHGAVYEYRATLSSLKNAYPKADWENFDDGWSPARTSVVDRVQTRFRQLFQTSIKSPVRTVTVYELWLKDDGTQIYTEEIDGKVLHRRKKKFANGWRVIKYAGGLVLNPDEADQASPYRHGQLPFIPVFCYVVPGRLHGVGHVQALLNIQIMHNRMNQLLHDSTVKRGGGIVLLGAGLDLDKSAITNAPVQVHSVRDVSQFRIEQFPDPPRHVYNYLDKLEQMGRDVVGQHEISTGQSPSGDLTAQEVNAISQSDRTRVRSISRQLAWSLERLLRQVVSNLAQFEDTEWFLRIAGEDGSEETMAVNPSKMFKRLDEKGRITDEMIRFDLKIDDSSMLPNTANETMMQALNLFDRQLLSRESTLKALRVSNPKQELALLDAEMERFQKKQAEAQAAQAPPPQAPPPQAPPMPEARPEAAPEMGAVPFDASLLTPDVMAEIEAKAAEAGVDPADILAQLGVV